MLADAVRGYNTANFNAHLSERPMDTNSTITATTPVPSTAAGPMLRPEDIPSLDDIKIDDGAPVDGIYAEKQMRLLVEPLQSSWPGPGDGREFIDAPTDNLVASLFSGRQCPAEPRLAPSTLAIAPR